jgi:hypothetical protein
VPPLEAWERVLIDMEQVSDDVHAFIRCTECHGGNNVPDMAEAHDGMITDPSDQPVDVCGQCHSDIEAAFENSLHATLAGYDTALYERSVPEDHPVIEEVESYHCNNCHASCGQCHISQPTSVGGGLLEGHGFVRQPPMTRTCTGCHGSRVKDEYTGRNEGFPADIHFTQAQMTCVACHGADEMHGVGIEADSRYDGERIPKCESCHEQALTPSAGIEEHTIHGQDVSCQVCHSVDYKQCSNCHVEQSEEGVPFYEIDPSWMDFRIGLNPNRTPERPWQYVLVRHVPVSPESFEYYGEDILLDFDARPTWLEATPHNIQLLAPQAQRCENCHGNPDIFLTEDAVAPDELNANREVIVSAPPSLDLVEQYRATISGAEAEEVPTEEPAD